MWRSWGRRCRALTLKRPRLTPARGWRPSWGAMRRPASPTSEDPRSLSMGRRCRSEQPHSQCHHGWTVPVTRTITTTVHFCHYTTCFWHLGTGSHRCHCFGSWSRCCQALRRKRQHLSEISIQMTILKYIDSFILFREQSLVICYLLLCADFIAKRPVTCIERFAQETAMSFRFWKCPKQPLYCVTLRLWISSTLDSAIYFKTDFKITWHDQWKQAIRHDK